MTDQPSLSRLPNLALERLLQFLLGRPPHHVTDVQSTINLCIALPDVWKLAKQLPTYKRISSLSSPFALNDELLSEPSCQLWKLLQTNIPGVESNLLLHVFSFLVGDAVDYRLWPDLSNFMNAHPRLHSYYYRQPYFLDLRQVSMDSSESILYKYPAEYDEIWTRGEDYWRGFNFGFYAYQAWHLTENTYNPKDPCLNPYRWSNPNQRPVQSRSILRNSPVLLGLPDKALNCILGYLANIGVCLTSYRDVRSLCTAIPALYCRRLVFLQSYYDISRRTFSKLAFATDYNTATGGPYIQRNHHLLPGMKFLREHEYPKCPDKGYDDIESSDHDGASNINEEETDNMITEDSIPEKRSRPTIPLDVTDHHQPWVKFDDALMNRLHSRAAMLSYYEETPNRRAKKLRHSIESRAPPTKPLSPCDTLPPA
jgi:hypothetical protein